MVSNLQYFLICFIAGAFGALAVHLIKYLAQ